MIRRSFMLCMLRNESLCGEGNHCTPPIAARGPSGLPACQAAAPGALAQKAGGPAAVGAAHTEADSMGAAVAAWPETPDVAEGLDNSARQYDSASTPVTGALSLPTTWMPALR